MADYAIGDVQGCFEPLLRLLDHLHFNEHSDRLWFVGDLVNRGPQSLDVLRFIKALPLKARISLGNHDLHLLEALFSRNRWRAEDDTISDILQASDGEELGHWLRKQSLLIHDASLNVVICHAGIAPFWDLPLAKALAKEVEEVLQGADYSEFLARMYGEEPDCWSGHLQGVERLRAIVNYFTRMRFCDAEGRLIWGHKDLRKADAEAGIYPWYAVPQRYELSEDLVFGHWAALMGECPHPRIHAIDTGCIWGGQLTALRLQDKKRFAVAGLK